MTNKAASLGDPSNTASFEVAVAMLPSEREEEVVERAAIIEFDGELGRDEAERLAVTEVVKKGVN